MEPLTSTHYYYLIITTAHNSHFTEHMGEQVIPNYNQMNLPCHISSTKYQTVKSLCNIGRGLRELSKYQKYGLGTKNGTHRVVCELKLSFT
jgi:hypothetical protein